MNPTALIPILVLLPLAGGLGLTVLPANRPNTIRVAALLWSLAALTIAVVIAYWRASQSAREPTAHGLTAVNCFSDRPLSGFPDLGSTSVSALTPSRCG